MDGLSSSVVIALAAVLWLAYLLPTWFKRREYLSTERNAVRLQQTLRIMAETAEVPDQVRVESSARSAAVQEKIMQREMQRTRAIQKAQDAAAARAAARQLAESRPAIAADVARSSQSSRRLRRSRLVSTLALIAALVGVVVGVAQLAAGTGWVLLAGSVVVAVGAVVLLAQLAAVSRARAQLAQGLERSAPVASPLRDMFPQQQALAAGGEWTPVPVPKPLYLSRPEAPAAPRVTFADAAARLARPAASTVTPDAVPDHAAELRDAAARSEQALRDAQQQTTRIAPAPAVEVPAETSRFARMGIIDDAELAPVALDEALRRRRAV
ncbi:DUF3040 domain-containing protein [Homoserinimonas aerilata]|nr:DUF3040 domain-containing protein [Homoserinimonas aerilata]